MDQAKSKTVGKRRKAPPTSEAIRRVANRYIVGHYPFGCLGGEPRQLVGKNGIWIVPVLLTSPGVGSVGEVGFVAIASDTREIVSATPRREATATLKQLKNSHGNALEAAFHRARTV